MIVKTVQQQIKIVNKKGVNHDILCFKSKIMKNTLHSTYVHKSINDLMYVIELFDVFFILLFNYKKRKQLIIHILFV